MSVTNNLKMTKLLRNMDMFCTSQFTLYRTKQSYGTVTGGLVSLLIVGGLFAILVNLAIETFQYSDIYVTTQNIIDSNPINYKITTGPAHKFMFAVGVVRGTSKDSPHFHIKMENFTTKTANNQYIASNQTQNLQQCNFTNWAGVSDQVTTQYKNLNMEYFLCPPVGLELEIEGKNYEETFKFIKLSLWNCTEYYQTGNDKNCPMGGIKGDSFNNQLPTFNILYINSVPNPSNLTAVSYYIEDINSFIVDLDTTFSVNIDFSQYSLTTDQSLFPWTSNSVVNGLTALTSATIQSYSKNDNMLGEINLRKSSQRLVIQRYFKKVSDVLSFVGGLLSPLLLAFSFLKQFSRLAYQIQFGDRIFKNKSTEAFASEAFGFFEYLKFVVYETFRHFGIGKKWESTKKYYKCRSQSIKQLDIHLLFRKIQYFEEVCNVVLDKHHLIGLQILSRKTLKQSKRERKRYMLQSLIYGSLQKLSSFVNIQEGQYAINKYKMLELYKDQIFGEDVSDSKKEKIDFQKELMYNYMKLEQQSQKGDKYSSKIMRRLRPQEDSIQIVEDQEMKGDLPMKFNRQIDPCSEAEIISSPTSI